LSQNLISGLLSGENGLLLSSALRLLRRHLRGIALRERARRK
jgi:hypothetical protein